MSDLLRRAMDILEHLRVAGGECGIREIAERVGLPRSTVQRILRDLVETDMATQDARTRRYRLGPRTLALGTAYQREVDLRGISRAPMRRLRDETGETVGLSVVVGQDLMHIDQVESLAQLRRIFEIGRPLPMWVGAPGRLALAEHTDDEARQIVSEGRRTGYDPVNPPRPERLLAEVATARLQGYAIAVDETIDGVSTASAPVRGHVGQLVAILSVTGPTSRFARGAMDEAIDPLCATAVEIGRLLGAAAS